MIPGCPRRVAVVLLTWNAIAFTRRCLESLETTTHPSWRLVVVDNGSTDGTPEWLATRAGLTLLRNRTNLGFTKAVNQGINSCDADEDIVLMNNDTRVTDPDWLTRLQEVAYADPSTGVVGTRLVDGSGTIIHLGSYMQPLTLRGQQAGGLEVDINQARRDRRVESVVFAQAYLRRDCIDVVGLLDEDLFAYFEDTDYCLRAEKAGFSVVFAGSVSTVHNQSTTTRENKVDFWSVYNRSQRVFERKWARWVDHDRYDAEIVWHSVLHRPLGYAVQSRKLMSAMHFSDLRVSYRNAYSDADGPTGDLLLDDLVRREPDPSATQIAFCQADVFTGVAGRRRVGWSMLEVTGLPEEWVRGANTMDEVWVPASFNLETFAASGVRVPIKVMPLGVDVDYFNPGIAAFRPSESFTFLSVFEWGERKAPEVLLRAYAEEFKESEDILLMLSVFNRDPMVDPQREIAAMDLPACPPIVLMINPEITGYQMGSLYRSADCFVAPSRGEGWGMTVLEAMACGLPTIATAWGGPADFLDETNGYPLNWKPAPAQARCPYYEGFDWAEPDVEHLRFLMREIVDHPEAARARGQVAAAEVAERWTWQQAAARVRARVLELG